MSYFKKYHNKIYIIVFVISIIIIIFLAIFTFFYLRNLINKSNSSKELSKGISITRLYSNYEDYETTYDSESEFVPFIIGIVKIDKLKLDYPILSDVSDELLEISPCRFAGPMPNEVGNLCIAGHNYIDNTFFAKISSLIKGDSIYIYDLSGNYLEYFVEKKYEVESSDTSILSQGTNGKRKLTLMTCNSLKGSRIVVEAYAKE